MKCLALGHAFRSVPQSPISFNASDGQPMDLGKIDAEHAVQRGPNVGKPAAAHPCPRVIVVI